MAGQLQLIRSFCLTIDIEVDDLHGKSYVQKKVTEGVVEAPERSKCFPGTVEQNLNIVHHMTKGEEEDEDVIVVDGVSGRDWGVKFGEVSADF